MKTLTIFLAFFLTVNIFAQSEKNLANAVLNYEKALKSGNPGMVESAIFHAAKYKLFYPERDTQCLKKCLAKLSKDGENDTLRYKAYLAHQMLAQPEIFHEVERKNYKDSNAFFSILATELQSRLLVKK